MMTTVRTLPTPLNMAVFIACHVRPLTDEVLFLEMRSPRRALLGIDLQGGGWIIYGIPPADDSFSRQVNAGHIWEFFDPDVLHSNYGDSKVYASQAIFREELFWPATANMPENVLHVCSMITAELTSSLRIKYDLNDGQEDVVKSLQQPTIVVASHQDVARFGYSK